MDPILLQQQLKNNNKDLLDFCQDLKSWGEEMQKKEQTLNPSASKRLHSVKSKPSDSALKRENVQSIKKSDGSKIAKKKCVSYSDWEKFDADKECEKVDEDSESELTDEYDESMKEEALVMKDKGNRFVKVSNWEEAIKCYTKAIEYFAYDPVFYANRALCYLKKNEMVKAENDCTISLKLDNTYVKAYQRRAVARESLNKFEDAKLDLLKVLHFEPKNSESLNHLEKLRKKNPSLQKDDEPSTTQRPLSKFTASRHHKKVAFTNQEVSKQVESKADDVEKPRNIWPTGEKYPLMKAIKKPPHLRSKKPLKRITIEETNSVNPKPTQIIEENISSWPRVNAVSKTINSDDFKIVEHKVHENQQENCVSRAEKYTLPESEQNKHIIATENDKEVKNIKNFDVIQLKDQQISCTEKLKIEEFVAPKSSVQFHLMWKKLKGHDDKKYEYLKLMNASSFPELFKESLESQIFSEILLILTEYFIKRNDKVYDYLLYLSKIKRFGALSMFFNLNDKNCLWKMFNHIKEFEGRSKEEVDKLIKTYEL